MESNNNPSTTATSNRTSQKVTEHHKTTQSHVNGTTMGRFPRLTLVRLSPQVPDHMTVSSLPPYIVVSTHQRGGMAASASELRSATDGAQVFKCTKLVRAVGRLQTTLAQVLGKCKSVCTCCRDSLLYEQWATTRDLSWMRLMKRRMCVRAMRSRLRSTKARMWEGSSVVGVDKRIV